MMDNQKTGELSSNEMIEQVTVDRLDAILAEGNFKIIDVREQQGIETQGVIPSAINIPFDSVGNTIVDPLETHHEVFTSEGPFLFCCTGGVMSYMAAILAREQGVKNVFNLEGGHSAWINLKELKAAV